MSKFFLHFLYISMAFGASNAVSTRYLDFGDTGQARLLAADASGNLFAVGLVTEPSGVGQIRVIKTDPSGNPLASIDFGGSFGDSVASAAVDPQGNIVIAGSTPSPDFPLVNALVLNPQPRVPAAFIVKIDAQLKTILLSTLLGGTNGSFASGNALAVDSKGNIFVAGSTDETDFPTTSHAFQAAKPAGGPGSQVATITEISAPGQILFSTFYGGSITGATTPSSIAADAAGNIFVAGATTPTNLPTTSGAYARQCTCVAAGFVAKFVPDLSKLTWATLIPPSDNGQLALSSIALQTDGSIVLSGATSAVLPPPPPPARKPETTAMRLYAGFVARLDATGSMLLSSTELGLVASTSTPVPIAVDSQGLIWTTGGLYVASISSSAGTLASILDTPAGAAGQAIVATANGPVSLGPTGSLLIGGSAQQPSLLGIANSAASQVSGITTPLELISLYGAGIGPSVPMTAQVKNVGPGNYSVVTSSLAGYQVLFNGVAAPLLYVSANQINAIVPVEAGQSGTTTVQIVTPNGTVDGPTLRIRPSQPQVFSGYYTAAALNQDGTLNSSGNPATPGSIVTVWATGAGLFTTNYVDGAILGAGGPGDLFSPAPLSLPLPVSMLAGNDSVQVTYAGAAPNAVQGVIQINFAVTGSSIFRLQIGSAVSDPFAIWITGLIGVAN
jgi:uncharacterized protein (TIGR03437 family)